MYAADVFWGRRILPRLPPVNGCRSYPPAGTRTARATVRRRATLGKLCPHWKRMQNDEIAKVLDEIADMLELSGENFFRVRAYHNAARSIHDQPVQVAELTLEQIDQISA